MSLMNRKSNALNPYQGAYKKVLCVCAGGLLRSPTAAEVLSRDPYNFNTRSCGMSEEFSLVLIDDILLGWADEIVVMDVGQLIQLKERGVTKPIINLSIPDQFVFREKRLIDLIRKNYDAQKQKV